MEIISSEKCLGYGRIGHPESSERVKQASNYLKNKNYKFIEPEPASLKDILRVHTKEYVKK